jgi:hypothetical protein
VSITRRAFGRILGAAPVAAPMLAANLKDVAMKEAVAQQLAAKAIGIGHAPTNRSWTAEQEAARALLDEMYGENLSRASWVADVAPDIACMKSWSDAYKIQAMVARKRERDSFIRRLRDIIYPPDRAGDADCAQATGPGGNRPNW